MKIAVKQIKSKNQLLKILQLGGGCISLCDLDNKEDFMSSDKAPFSWEDPFQTHSQFSEEERMIQESARDYAQDKLLSRVRDAFRHETFDREIMNEFGAMGMLGATLPEKYGCANVNYVSYGIMAREVEMVDSGYRSAMSVQSSLVMHPIYAYGTEAQREKPIQRAGAI